MYLEFVNLHCICNIFYFWNTLKSLISNTENIRHIVLEIKKNLYISYFPTWKVHVYTHSSCINTGSEISNEVTYWAILFIFFFFTLFLYFHFFIFCFIILLMLYNLFCKIKKKQLKILIVCEFQSIFRFLQEETNAFLLFSPLFSKSVFNENAHPK